MKHCQFSYVFKHSILYYLETLNNEGCEKNVNKLCRFKLVKENKIILAFSSGGGVNLLQKRN